jgi:hypothetical protein
LFFRFHLFHCGAEPLLDRTAGTHSTESWAGPLLQQGSSIRWLFLDEMMVATEMPGDGTATMTTATPRSRANRIIARELLAVCRSSKRRSRSLPP